MLIDVASEAMTAEECYRILGLRTSASFDEVKTRYRRLARQYHPDINPGDRYAQDAFVRITAAYKFLMAVQPPVRREPHLPKVTVTAKPAPPPPHRPTAAHSPIPPPAASPSTTAPIKAPPIQFNPALSPLEHQLKVTTYQQLQQFLKLGRFPRAIALVEGLAQRIPQDPEIVQWQAIAYQRWGRQLIRDRHLDKARLYLKKALSTDPHNRALWAEIEKDFHQIERLF
jgi:tetratricopeptide (TPR) repeat protein